MSIESSSPVRVELAVTELLTGGATPRQRRRYETILNSALDVIRENGYSQASMEAIASRSSVGLATIYRYFQSRDKLLFLVTDLWVSEVARGIRENVPKLEAEQHILASMHAGQAAFGAEPRILEAWALSHVSRDTFVTELAGSSKLFERINSFTFGPENDPELPQALSSVMENTWFAGIVRWALGQREWEQVGRDMEVAVQLVFRAFR